MKCPHCDNEIHVNPVSNADRTVTLEIPEHHFALMRSTFNEMSVRMGMLGFGELANELKPYTEKFSQDREHLRYFDEKPLALAFLALYYGYVSSVKIGKERSPVGTSPEPRVDVTIEFIGDNGKKVDIKVAENAVKTAAIWFKSYFEDAAERMEKEG